MFFSKKKRQKTPPSNDLTQGLAKTRQSLFGGLKSVFSNKNQDEIVNELENRLLSADVGLDTTAMILANIKQKLKNSVDKSDWLEAIKTEISDLLKPIEVPLNITNKKPFVILVVGVNGAGKTTTIGKMAKQFKDKGNSVMLAAGDTFRAAAVEQLQSWGERYDIKVNAQKSGADSASVIFDTIDSAVAKNIDIVIADTAGRLHTQDNLMAELAKINRVIKKHNPDYPHETLLVLDAGTGQNALSQIDKFNQLLKLSGLVLTKMDGTAKGGVLLTLAYKTKLPVRFIGIGEQADDLREFIADDFIEAIME